MQEDAPVIERAHGTTLWDTDGRSYIDGTSSLSLTDANSLTASGLGLIWSGCPGASNTGGVLKRTATLVSSGRARQSVRN